MKPRLQRVLAALMSVSLLGAQVPVNTWAETVVEEAAAANVQAAEETAPETQDPAPVEAPAPVTETPETPAPVTEAPAPATEAPAPVTEAPTPVTEAPAPVTETPAADPVIEAPTTEPQTVSAADNQQTEIEAPQSESGAEKESDTEKKTEKDTEKETEKEKKATVFKTEADGVKVSAQLAKADALPESTKLVVKTITAESDKNTYEDAVKKVKKVTNQGHRTLSTLRLYTVSFTDKKGKTVSVKGDVTLTFTSKDGVDLKLGRYLEPGALTFLIGSTEAEEADEAVLTEKALVESFTFTGKAGDKIALAGVQNRENDGDEIKAATLKKKFADFGKDTKKDEKTDGKETEKESKKDKKAALDDADEYALTLSNASSSKDVVVVNLYVNAEGKISTEPLKAVLDEKKEAIDVSEHSVVINIVAYTKDQKLTLPKYKVVGKGSAEENAGKVLYNIVTENADGEAQTYKGTLTVDEAVSGTILAAKATVKLDAKLMGTVYADTLDGDEKQITEVELGYTDKKDEAEEETEAVSEEATEKTVQEAEESADSANEVKAAPLPETLKVSLGVEAVAVEDTEDPKKAMSGFTYELLYAGADGALNTADDVTLLAPLKTSDTDTAFALDLNETDEAHREVYEQIRNALYNDGALNGEVKLGVKQTDSPDTHVIADENKAVQEVKLTIEENQLKVNPDKLIFENKKFDGFIVATKVVDVNLKMLTKDTQIKITAQKADGTEVELNSGVIAGTDQADAELQSLRLRLDQEKLRETLGLDTGASLDGQKIKVSQIPASEYMPAAIKDWARELTLSVKPDGEQPSLKVLEDGADIAENEGITLVDKRVNREVTVSVDSVLQGTDNRIQGITYRLLDEKGTVLNNSILSTATAPVNATAKLTDEQLAALQNALQNADTKTISWTIEAMTHPNYDRVSAQSQTITLQLDDSGETFTVKAAPAPVKFEYTQQPQITQDKVRVTKYNYHNNSGIFFNADQTYYVALYDANGTRVTTIRSITIPKGQSSAFTEFSGLRPGVYTVHEVTQAGEIVQENAPGVGQFYATYEVEGQAGQNVAVAGTVPSGQTYNAVINNNYLTEPTGTSYYAAFRVQKAYFDDKNAAKKVTGNFYYKVYDAKTNKPLNNTVYSVTLNNASAGNGKRIRMKMTSANAERQLKIVETDGKGKTLVSGETYDITYDNQTFTLTPSQKKEVRVVIRNTEVAKKTEAEGPATLTLTKKVTYKGQPIRVNAVYYIGIFDDAGLSKLRYKKAMRFSNASEVSSPLTIHIEKLKEKAVTFYFAEVDANGKVVSGGKTVGYDISQNKKSITLNADNLKDELVITNDVLPGTRTAAALTAPGSTFAGDPAALAEAQRIDADKNAGTKTSTGDDSPIVPLAIALVLSAGVLSALGIMVKKRRK